MRKYLKIKRCERFAYYIKQFIWFQDEKYSSKREKNNLAVKRCREKKKNEEKYKKEAFENLIRSNLVKDQKIEQLNNLVQSGKQRENARIMEVQREKNILRQLKNELYVFFFQTDCESLSRIFVEFLRII